MDKCDLPSDSLAQIDGYMREHLFSDERNCRELLALFFLTVPDRLAEAQVALAEVRWGDLARLAHVIRGASGHVGAKQLSAQAAMLEQTAAEPNAAVAVSQFRELQQIFLELQQEFNALGKLPS